ncbi:ComEA family DNA-binding protein [Dyella sp. 20L07]|uniref:ComEA family DNA-binding protein n=1 Tax=Dyella sp. 20L07 TaxID=3384240 RepID=UPI003D29CEBF
MRRLLQRWESRNCISAGEKAAVTHNAGIPNTAADGYEPHFNLVARLTASGRRALHSRRAAIDSRVHSKETCNMRNKLAALLLGLALSLPAWASTPVNVNKADAATISHSLDGIGPSKAAAIVAWREEHGPFKSVDDLSQVKGVGPATLERNRDAILLGDAAGDSKPDNKAPTAKAKPKPAKAADE